MRRLYILLYCILFVGLITKPCWSEDVFSRVDGYKWELLTKAGKLSWVEGFTNGVDTGMGETGLFFIEYCRNNFGRSLTFDIDLLKEALTLSEMTLGQVADGLDKFYENYQNKKIRIAQAVYLVKLEVIGAPQEFVEEVTRIFRIPLGERHKEQSDLLEKNQAYKDAWEKWGEHIPTIMLW